MVEVEAAEEDGFEEDARFEDDEEGGGVGTVVKKEREI